MKDYADKKWPAMNPGMMGFDYWMATEASASSSTTNCGCVPAWKNQGEGCIIGGGNWTNKALECTNYWSFAPGAAQRPECLDPTQCPRDCVQNYTSKIEGDDSIFMVEQLLSYLDGREGEDSERPFFVYFHLHTNHVPHPSLPEYFHAYKDVNGDPAGDYLGTISQMDAALGQLIAGLKQRNLYNDTIMAWTPDNGPHTQGHTRPSGQLAASNGLRQCKASIFNGGILVPGIIHWPAQIKKNRSTERVVSTVDWLPTFLEYSGVKHPHPDWATDGQSLLPLLTGEQGDESGRGQLLGFAQGGQYAIVNQSADGTQAWKIVQHPEKGQCDDFLPPFDEPNPCPYGCLFDLTKDMTETNNVCKENPDVCTPMRNQLDVFKASIENSRVNESQCMAPQGTHPDWVKLPTEGGYDVPTQGTRLRLRGGKHCLTLLPLKGHAVPVLGGCDGGSQWELRASTTSSGPTESLALSSAVPALRGMCFKAESGYAPGTGQHGTCLPGNTVWLGPCSETS